MEQISKETIYLVNNNIASSNQLEVPKDELKQDIDVTQKKIDRLK